MAPARISPMGITRSVRLLDFVDGPFGVAAIHLAELLPVLRADQDVREHIRAVFIPHPYTWSLEEQEIDPADGGVLHLVRFPELLEHF